MPWPWSLLAVPFLIALNAFFVAGEYAVVALRGHGVELLRQRGHHRAAAAMEALKADTARTIGTIQVCITLVNLLLGSVGEPAMTEALRALVAPLAHVLPEAAFRWVSFLLSFFVVTLLTVVFSELLPKATTLTHALGAARLTALPIHAIARGLGWLVAIMNGMANLATVPLGLGRVDRIDPARVTTEELRLLTAEAAADGVLTPRERGLILNTLTLGRRTARQIMVPRVHVTYLDLQRSMEDNRRAMDERLYSRLPLCDGGMDRVIGIVHTKEFLSAYVAEGDVKVLALIARPAVFAPEITPLDKLLPMFQEQRTQIVMLVDEYGGAAGVVTLRDVMDELLGTVSAAAPTGSPSGGEGSGRAAASITVPGDTPLHELAQRLGRPEWCSTEDAATVGGLVQSRLGKVPARGERVEVDGVALRILRSDRRAVQSVEVSQAGAAEGR